MANTDDLSTQLRTQRDQLVVKQAELTNLISLLTRAADALDLYAATATVTAPLAPVAAPVLSPAATPAPTPAATPAPTAAPAPTPAPQPLIAVADHPNTLLAVGNSWLEDGVWGQGALTRGVYTDINGAQFEQQIGIDPQLGPNGEVAGRVTWKWPTGTTEVKSYESLVTGNKPGYSNTWITPAGESVVLPDGTQSQVYPSGKTPNSIFPLQLPLASLKSSFDYAHNQPPTGRGHLTYDIFLQKIPDQTHGFNSQGEISHEIMIPVDFWGGYGQYPKRNPAWYSHDVTLDGVLWHVYYDPLFNSGQWKFIVFEPDAPLGGRTLNLDVFINYLATQKDPTGAAWANGNEYCVSVEFGVEPMDGTGDITMRNYRVWK